jgi:hypothetical protein
MSFLEKSISLTLKQAHSIKRRPEAYNRVAMILSVPFMKLNRNLTFSRVNGRDTEGPSRPDNALYDFILFL